MSRSITIAGWRFVAFAPKAKQASWLMPSFGAIGLLAFVAWLVGGGR